ncbi:MAG: SRPBCC family protein [Myxococcales bacterium]|nr:SRPBCC family protein [Myxococcales bacterium]
MKVATHASVECAVSVEKLFDAATSMETLSTILRPVGPLPGVERAWIAGGAAIGAGVHRSVVLTDGATLDEEITAWAPPRTHEYRVTGFAAPFSLLVESAIARWSFESLGASRSRVLWRYEFALTSRLALPLALPLVKLAMNKLMRSTLENLSASVGR